MYVRTFQRKDFARLLELADDMRVESPKYRNLGIDNEKLLELGALCVDRADYMCGLVAIIRKGAENIEGFFLGCCTEFYFNHNKNASDLALYVPQTRRGGVAAVALIKGYEDWAEGVGAQEMSLGITTGVNEDKTVGMYEKLGFKRSGIICTKKRGY